MQTAFSSPSAVLQEVSQFSDAELDDFFTQITRLRAKRRASHLSEQTWKR